MLFVGYIAQKGGLFRHLYITHANIHTHAHTLTPTSHSQSVQFLSEFLTLAPNPLPPKIKKGIALMVMIILIVEFCDVGVQMRSSMYS